MSLRVFPDTERSLTHSRQGQVQDGARSNLPLIPKSPVDKLIPIDKRMPLVEQWHYVFISKSLFVLLTQVYIALGVY